MKLNVYLVKLHVTKQNKVIDYCKIDGKSYIVSKCFEIKSEKSSMHLYSVPSELILCRRPYRYKAAEVG